MNASRRSSEINIKTPKQIDLENTVAELRKVLGEVRSSIDVSLIRTSNKAIDHWTEVANKIDAALESSAFADSDPKFNEFPLTNVGRDCLQIDGSDGYGDEG